MKKYLKLFYVFAILGLQLLGNLSSMYPILEEELVKKRKLLTSEDILDGLALGRCGPGAAVVNTIVFLGNKCAGTIGGILAIFSFLFFPFIIILIISLFIDKFLESSIVQSAFKGVTVALLVMILNSIIDLSKKTIKDKITWVVFLVGLVLILVFKVSSVIVIISAIACGILILLTNGKNILKKTK